MVLDGRFRPRGADLLANEAAVLLLSEIREREGAKEKIVGVEAQNKKK